MSTPPTVVQPAHSSTETAPSEIRSIVVCATPGAGEEAVADALRRGGAGTPRAWFDTYRVAPALLAAWHITDLDDYIVALHERQVTTSGVFPVILHWHELRRLYRQVAGLRQPTAQRLLDVVHVIAPTPVFVLVRREDRAAHVAALHDLEHPGAQSPSPAERRTLEARIDATEAVWTQWFDAVSVQPVVVSYERLTAEPAASADVIARLDLSST